MVSWTEEMRAYKIAIGVFNTVVVALVAVVVASVAALILVPRVSRYRSEVAISKVGAARLVAEVAALKEKAPALQALGPDAVHVTREGVYLERWQIFVWEQGVFIAFPGGPSRSTGGDPSFWQIAPNVYWYEIKG
jgi:hypothetical protein